MRKVISIRADEFSLECEMENGEIFKYDMSFLKNEDSEMVKPLKKLDFFKQVFIELGSISWPNGYEIHADTVAKEGELISRIAS